MKKLSLVLAAALLNVSVLVAYSPERVESLAAKTLTHEKTGYFVLSDGSLWKAVRFDTRSRSLSEWWNNVQLVPDNYECFPKDWNLGAQIEVYSKYGNLNIDERDAYNEQDLKSCTHLLVNSHTGQVLFAQALHPAEGILRIVAEAQNRAFEETNGNYHKGYNDGYYVGYHQGYQEGYNLGVTRCPDQHR